MKKILVAMGIVMMLVSCQTTSVNSSAYSNTHVIASKAKFTVNDRDFTIQSFEELDDGDPVLALWKGRDFLAFMNGVFVEDGKSSTTVEEFTNGLIWSFEEDSDIAGVERRGELRTNTDLRVMSFILEYEKVDRANTFQIAYVVEVKGGFVGIYTTVINQKAFKEALHRSDAIMRTVENK